MTPPRRGSILPWLALLLIAGCDAGAGPGPASGSSDGSAAEARLGGLERPASVPFTLRGRWARPVRVAIRLAPEGGPVPPEVFQEAALRAATAWSAARDADGGRLVEVCEASSGETPLAVVGWAPEMAPDTPQGFVGSSGVIAHTGPMEPGTFVHLNAGRRWSPDGAEGHGLYQALLHEMGHLLGLGESPVSEAVMSPRYAREHTGLTEADLAGLRTLYGRADAPAGPGDLVVRDDAGGPLAVLRGLLDVPDPRLALADTDGDGSSELLHWSGHPRLLGSLTVFHFGAGARPARTRGPRPGLVQPADRALVRRRMGSGGEPGPPLLLFLYPGGAYRAYGFNARGWPLDPLEPGPLHLVGGGADTDGDGVLDATPPPRLPLDGDLDGDGRPERLEPGRER